jgi:dUTPase
MITSWVLASSPVCSDSGPRFGQTAFSAKLNRHKEPIYYHKSSTMSATGSIPSTAQSIVFTLCPGDESRDLYAPLWKNEKRDSGVDLRFPGNVLLPEGQTTSINLGVRATCTVDGNPSGFWLATRSSFTKTPQILMLRNFMGVIDAQYRGPLIARVHNFGPGDFTASRGESLFQILEPLMRPPISVVARADDPLFTGGSTARGEGGFGSTGVAGQT